MVERCHQCIRGFPPGGFMEMGVGCRDCAPGWGGCQTRRLAVWRLSAYADATMRSVLIRLCLVTVYVLVLFEVGMVLGQVT